MTEIVLAGLWVDADGVSHAGGEVVEVDGDTARRLIYNGQGLPVTVAKEARKTTATKRTRRAGK